MGHWCRFVSTVGLLVALAGCSGSPEQLAASRPSVPTTPSTTAAPSTSFVPTRPANPNNTFCKFFEEGEKLDQSKVMTLFENVIYDADKFEKLRTDILTDCPKYGHYFPEAVQYYQTRSTKWTGGVTGK